MRFKTKVALAYARKTGIALGSVETDKGTLHFLDELRPGVDVWFEDAGGATVMPEVGDYIAGEQVISVIAGVVEAVRDAAETNGVKKAPRKEKVKTKMEDAAGQGTAPGAGGVVSVEMFDGLAAGVEALRAEVKEISDVVSEVSGELKSAVSLSGARFVAPVDAPSGEENSRANLIRARFDKKR